MPAFRTVATLCKVETTYGVDPVPTGAANALITKNVNIQPYQGNTVTRDQDRPTLGAQSAINVAPNATISFGFEFAGAGAAGTVPKYGPILRAGGFSETVSAGVSVTYAPVTAFESATMYFYDGLNVHKLIGLRGNVEPVNAPRGGIPEFRFNGTGFYITPTAASIPALTLTGWQAPLPITKNNTTMLLHGYAAICESFALNMNSSVVHRNVINSEQIMITDRNPTGQLTIEMPALASHNYFVNGFESHAGVTLGAVGLVHGIVAGNIMEISGPQVQLSNPQRSNSDGLAVYSMDTTWVPTSAGNDEVLIIVR